MIRFDPASSVAKTDADVIVNTVNTVGVMGAGVAKAVKDRYPEIMEPYTEACRTRKIQPGGVQVLRMNDGKIVVNLASKEHFKDPSKPEWAGYGLLNLRRVLGLHQMRDVKSVLLPPPGAGLGGLSPETVQRMIRTYMREPAEAGVEIIVSTDMREIRPRPIRYAGIGSRETPKSVLSVMTETAQALAEREWILRSGNAIGADLAFENGAPIPLLESYLPWPKDEMPHGITTTTPQHTRLMQTVYVNPIGERWRPGMLGRAPTLLMTRNGNQIFGTDFSEPTDVVICYTPGGEEKGGTRQAIALANLIGIPVLNLGKPEWEGASAEAVTAEAVRIAHAQRAAIGVPVEERAPSSAPAP